MKILHTVEFYSPSVGGAQEVVRQISERLVKFGHRVTVATSYLPERKSEIINGVKITEFKISGNAVRGYHGDTEMYQQFLIDGDFDVMLNYAAQEWSMDLVFPILDQIPYPKVMVPCGFSGLFDPAYSEYFKTMPDVMRQYDHIVFHANTYRDIDFTRQHGINHHSLIPNGASEIEFDRTESGFRERYGIRKDVPMLITVGSHTSLKGHRLCMKSLKWIDKERISLVIIGNLPTKTNPWKSLIQSIIGALRGYNVIQVLRVIARAVLGGVASGCIPDDKILSRYICLRWMGKKRVYLLDPIREDVVAALQDADLFIFGSNIEYSPLVLFEALASKTPFVSLECGNASEIVSWSGGGVLAPTVNNEDGFVDGDPKEFAKAISSLLSDDSLRIKMAERGYQSWVERFTWEKITLQYEKLYKSLTTL